MRQLGTGMSRKMRSMTGARCAARAPRFSAPGPSTRARSRASQLRLGVCRYSTSSSCARRRGLLCSRLLH